MSAAVLDEISRATTATVWSLFAARAAVAPDRIAITDGVREVSYRHLAARVASCATALAVRGVGPGSAARSGRCRR